MELTTEAVKVRDLQSLQNFIGRLNKDNINSTTITVDNVQTTPLIFAILQIIYINYKQTPPVYSPIESILEIEGINVNLANKNGETALMVAVKENLLEITNMLLKKGADVNKKNDRGMTALMKVKNNVGMVNALIDYKADIKKMDNDGNTALSHYVAYPVDIDQIKTLIEKGADVNAGCYNLKYLSYGLYNIKKDYSSSTPLMNVIVNYNGYTESKKELMELMLSKGADVNLFDSARKTAIEYCILRKDWKDLLDVILNYTTKNGIEIERKEYEIYGDEEYDKELYLYEKEIMIYNEDEFKRLICSSTERNKEDQEAKVILLEKMLELGIDKFLGKTPQEKTKDDIIVCAAILGKSDKVKQLITDGANVNVKFFYQKFRDGVNYNSSTALMCAAEKGNDKIVELLLSDKNIDVDVEADNGWTALSYAIKSENTKLVKLLVKKTNGSNNEELLMTVVKMIHRSYFPLVEFVRIILNIKGVDVNFENSEGQTALMYLVSQDTYNSDERIETILNTSEEIIKSEGFNLNAQDDSGKTALMYFIEKNPEIKYNKLIEEILQIKGVNVNLKDTSGKSALFYAVIANNSTITEAILKIKGVDVKDNSGKTALFYANKPEMAKLLLRYKIPVDEIDNYGKTALFYVPSKVIKSLKGADVNIKDKVGKTALFDKKNMAEKVKELLYLGADVNVEDNEGNNVIMAIIEKLGDDSSESPGVLMEILKKVPNLDLSYKNQKGYNVITYLFSTDLDTKMIYQVLEYCYKNIAQNQFLFNHVYEVEYYITYIKNEMKKKKENTEEFEKIIESLEKWKPHVSHKPGSQEVRNAARRFSEIALNPPQINYPPSKEPRIGKFGGRPRRRSTLRVPLVGYDFAVSRPAKRRSCIKKKSQSATGANAPELPPSLRSGRKRRRSKRKTTVRYSPSRKYP